MRVLIAGASGFLGTALATRLEEEGDTVVRLRRGAPGPLGPTWDPEAGMLEEAALEGVTAVVNLAGESIASGWWTAARRRRIRDSRCRGTDLLARAAAVRRHTIDVMVNVSAVGIYGDQGEAELTEDRPPGEGFLAEVVKAWEAATRPAADAGVRVVLPRFGVLLDPSGGMLRQLLPSFRLGLGAPLGGGQQWMSWLALDDAVTLLLLLIRDPALSGAINAVSPGPVRNAEFTAALGAALRRPTLLRAPAWALRLALGDLADELLLASQRCRPARLEARGFRFAYPVLGPALEAMLCPVGGRIPPPV